MKRKYNLIDLILTDISAFDDGWLTLKLTITPWIGLMWKAKPKTYCTFASDFFSNFRVYWLILFSFLFWLQRYLKFLNITKIDLFMELFFGGWNTFFLRKYEESMRRFLSSFRHVPHNVSRIFAKLLLTLWQECEENVRRFLSSFRHVPDNVSGIPATLWA